jgi:hypothetical protein
MIGVLVGTYSSIFIASPTLIYLPWLWEQSGSTVKGFFKRVVPYAVVCFVGLMLFEWRSGALDGDWSKTGFVDAIISVPLGTLLLFLTQFVHFVRRPDDLVAEAA